MAAINDLITQIADEVLKSRLLEEVKRLLEEKKFGLVFENHLPEVLPVYSAKIEPGCLVVIKNKSISDVWRVLSINENQVFCFNQFTKKPDYFNSSDLVVVRQLGIQYSLH